MSASEINEPFLILLIGVIAILAVLLQSRMKALGIPSLAGFILLGFAIRAIDTQVGFLTEQALRIFDLLGKIGVICLLFRIGLDSDVVRLVKQIRHAAVIYAAGVIVNGVAGFSVAHWLLGADTIPSIFVGVALTASSVGVAVAVWQDSSALNTTAGDLLVDAAELNDLSGVVFVALLFAVAPVIRGGPIGEALPALGRTLLIVLVKLIGFSALCLLFSRFAEKRYTRFFSRVETNPGFTITLAATAFVLAAVAGLLGFSVAIGAFFAGLVFSRDPDAVRMEASFSTIYNLFVPFFFIGIGLSFDPQAAVSSLGIGAVLSVVAILPTFLAVTGSSLPFMNGRAAVLIGLSKIPRAEITMIIMQTGRNMGSWAVPAEIFGAMVVVSLVTSTAIPLLLKRLFILWPDCTD